MMSISFKFLLEHVVIKQVKINFKKKLNVTNGSFYVNTFYLYFSVLIALCLVANVFGSDVEGPDVEGPNENEGKDRAAKSKFRKLVICTRPLIVPAFE